MTDLPTYCPICFEKEMRDGLPCGKCMGRLLGCLWSIVPSAKEHLPKQDRDTGVTVGGRQTLPWETSTEGWTGLGEQLEVSYVRGGQRAPGVGGRSAEDPAPFDAGAAEARDDLRNVLVTWVRELWYDGEPLPRNEFPAIARWLIRRKDRIRNHPAVKEIHDDIVSAVRQASRVIDTRPAKEFIGPCPICGDGDVYAVKDAESGICRACQEVIPGIPDMLERNDKLAQDHLVPRRELLPVLADIWGMAVKDATLRKWVQRGQLQPMAYRIADEIPDPDGGPSIWTPRLRGDVDENGAALWVLVPEPLYRVGDALDLAVALRGRRATEQVSA